jgi:hypothetical protein
MIRYEHEANIARGGEEQLDMKQDMELDVKLDILTTAAMVRALRPASGMCVGT